MEPGPRQVIQTRMFERWLVCLQDVRAKALVLARVERLRAGNFGDHRAIGGGVWELRIHFGPGLRVYFAWEEDRVVILLGGGTKGSQRADVLLARAAWRTR